MPHYTKVLITAIGTMNCTTIIRELRNAPKPYFIIGADINEKYCIANSNEVDEYYQFPKVVVDRDNYAKYVINFCKEHNIELLFCVIDEEVEKLALYREEFNKIGTTLCIPDTNTIITCHNKLTFAKWCENKFPKYSIVRYDSIEDIKADSFPLFLKPIEGRASIGCKKIDKVDELYPYLNQWDKYIVQKFVTGDIIAVDIVRNKLYNQILSLQKLEILRNSNGCGIAVKIVDIPSIKEACINISLALDINGVVNMEFFMTDTGPKIIEINPRIPAGVAYSCMAGLNPVLNAIHIAQGEECDFSELKIGSFYAKRYETFETSI